MRIADWIARLKSETNLEVKGVADYATAQAEHRRDTCYVMYSADDAAPNEIATGPVRQQHTLGVDVVLALTNRRSARGREGIDEIEDARNQVLDALVDWEPPGTDGPITYRRGRLAAFVKGTIWWEDAFEVDEIRASSSKSDDEVRAELQGQIDYLQAQIDGLDA